jgi:hypothetical protein
MGVEIDFLAVGEESKSGRMERKSVDAAAGLVERNDGQLMLFRARAWA